MVDRKHARDKSKQQKTIARQKIPSSVVDDPDPLTVLNSTCDIPNRFKFLLCLDCDLSI